MSARARGKAPSHGAQLRAIRALIMRCLAEDVATREQLAKLSAKIDAPAPVCHAPAEEDPLAAARGIIYAAVVSVVFWGGAFAIMVWAGVWRH